MEFLASRLGLAQTGCCSYLKNEPAEGKSTSLSLLLPMCYYAL